MYALIKDKYFYFRFHAVFIQTLKLLFEFFMSNRCLLILGVNNKVMMEFYYEQSITD